MLQVSKETLPDRTVFKLAGSIDESDNLTVLFGALKGKVDVHTHGITKINSIGVKNWIRYFTDIQKNGANLEFLGFSPALIDQLNMIHNFDCGAPVSSLLLPYRCGSCGASEMLEKSSEGLIQASLQPPVNKCKRCGASMEFDDIVEDYFNFLSR